VGAQAQGLKERKRASVISERSSRCRCKTLLPYACRAVPLKNRGTGTKKKGKPPWPARQRQVSLENVERLRCCLACLFSRERQEGDVPAPLDGNGDLPLVAGTVAGNAAGKDLAALGDEELYGLEVLVVDKR
jgi:hypothetical protein